MEVLIVIVNYKSAELTVDCLASLEAEVAGHPGVQAVVVENDSGPEQAPTISRAIEERGWGGWASLVLAPSNAGFAAGNNVAIAPALASADPPRFVWLLNPDTIVRPGGFAALLDFFGRNPKAGLAGSRMEHLDGSVQISNFRFPSVVGELSESSKVGLVGRLFRSRLAPRVVLGEQEGPVDWVAGASLMVRREVFDAIGLLDDRYFMYFEEVDFCLRALKAGWPCYYVPSSRVVHLIGQSSGVTSREGWTRRRPGYWFDARRYYYTRHHGRAKAVAADLARMLGYGVYRVRYGLTRKELDEPVYFLPDLFRRSLLAHFRPVPR